MTDSCGEGHCVTCSDEGIEMRVERAAAGGLAVCSGPDGSAEVMTDLVGEVAAGETVLVHAGVAIARVP